MAENEKVEFENLEQEVFKALDHQMRRDVLRYVGERKVASFTDMLNALKIPDSPTLSYHLRTLAPFIEQDAGKYRLTPMGKDAFQLLLKSGTYGMMAIFQKKRYGATFGNLLLWGIAIAASAYLEANISLIAIIMPFCAFISAGTTWQLFEGVK